MHCDPAPPHPDPNQVYNAICIPTGGGPDGLIPSMVVIAVFVGVGVGLYWLAHRHGRPDAAD